MANIELVIKIPEGLKKDFEFEQWTALSCMEMKNALMNGTILPKGHGKLKDADKIANEVNALKDNWNRYGNEYESGRYESYDYVVDTIDSADTIIEADIQNASEKEDIELE